MTQTFGRVENLCTGKQQALLVTGYEEKGRAEIHLKALRDDQYGAIIQLCEKKHFDKFISMLEPASPYQVYWCVVKDAARLERQLNLGYADHMRRYIGKNTGWTIGGKDKIQASFEVTFGELFVSLKWRSQRQRVKFEEIEKS